MEPSTSRKRPRDKESEPESENDAGDSHSVSLEENLTFSDTLMALRMMRAQFPHIDKEFKVPVKVMAFADLRKLTIVTCHTNGDLLDGCYVPVSVQPFILRSQLYSSIKDRTQVDRELESLRRDGVLRIFKLNTGQDDHAIMFIDDYINQIEHVVRRMEGKKQNDLTIFEWFKLHVLQSKLDTSIGHEELCTLLSLGGKVKEEHISQLINAGLLIRQLIDQNMYWFSIPNIGSVLKGLSQGRKELLSFLNRRKYEEMMLASLEKKRLRFSPLDMRFHLRDLIGSGHLKTIQRPSGLIVRVAKD